MSSTELTLNMNSGYFFYSICRNCCSITRFRAHIAPILFVLYKNLPYFC